MNNEKYNLQAVRGLFPDPNPAERVLCLFQRSAYFCGPALFLLLQVVDSVIHPAGCLSLPEISKGVLPDGKDPFFDTIFIF